MAQNTAANIEKKAALATRVHVDEELWFGNLNTKDAEQAAALSMAAMAGRLVGAKPFPAAARRLAELVRNEASKNDEIIEVLEQDPGLSAKLLKLVNSAALGLRSRCNTVRHAVTLLGHKQLNQMAITAAALDLFYSDSAHATQVLKHSAVVGAFCRYLGAHLSLPAEELFTAGVLHDIGKLMLLDTLGSGYSALLDQVDGHADALHVLERADQGFDHAVLAAHVLKEWRIPDPIPKLVAWHHEPTRAYASSSELAGMVQTMRLSDALACAMDAGASRAEVAELAKCEAANYLDISEMQLSSMWDELSTLRSRTLDQHNDAAGGETRSSHAATAAPERTATATAVVPKQLLCIECHSPSFGAMCPACKGYLCAEHPIGINAWCVVCASEYQTYANANHVVRSRQRTLVQMALFTLVVTALGAFMSGTDGRLRGLAGGLLLSAFVTGTTFIVQRTLRRARFVQSRPNRLPA